MEEWNQYRLIDILDTLIDYRGKTPKKTISGVPLITAKIIKNGRIETPTEFISFDDEEDSIEYVLGSDNNLYLLDDEDEITIPGAKGNGGEFKGKKLNISNVVRMYKVNHTDGTGEIEDESLGLLLIKEDGKISIIRHPEKNKTTGEILDNKYIVDVYTPVDNISKTGLIDIDGNTHILK